MVLKGNNRLKGVKIQTHFGFYSSIFKLISYFFPLFNREGCEESEENAKNYILFVEEDLNFIY